MYRQRIHHSANASLEIETLSLRKTQYKNKDQAYRIGAQKHAMGNTPYYKATSPIWPLADKLSHEEVELIIKEAGVATLPHLISPIFWAIRLILGSSDFGSKTQLRKRCVGMVTLHILLREFDLGGRKKAFSHQQRAP